MDFLALRYSKNPNKKNFVVQIQKIPFLSKTYVFPFKNQIFFFGIWAIQVRMQTILHESALFEDPM